MKKRSVAVALFVLMMWTFVFAADGKFELPIDVDTIATIVTVVFSILASLGVQFKKFDKIMHAINESLDVPKVFVSSLKDRKWDPEEVDQLVKEINEAEGAWKEVKLSQYPK